MFKIKLSNEVNEAHKKYYKNKILPKLKKSEIQFVDTDAIKVNYKYKKRYVTKYIQLQHEKFIKYCINNYKRISTGNFNELRNVEIEISNLYPIITKLIKDKFEFSKGNTQHGGKKYWELVFELFGYKEFGDCSLYDVIRDSAKNYTSIKSIDSDKERECVQGRMIYILKELFPKIEDEIDNNLIVSDFSGNKVVEKMEDFKKKFKALEKKFSLALTLDNYRNNIFYGSWNAYLFVFSSGIRTCPYCNRQYITPILTSSGMMRGDLDHFVAKNQYPYFSMSLYNLVPVCHSCNSSFKGKKEFDFDYVNPYEESMDDYIRFHANMIINTSIHIDIDKKTLNKENEIKRYLDTFKLESQYNYHINQVEELILKRLIYPKEYITDINNKRLENFNITEKKIKEQLIGYTEDKLKINDEPLSKFRRDIVEQLDFFDDSDLYLINKLEEILEDNT